MSENIVSAKKDKPSLSDKKLAGPSIILIVFSVIAFLVIIIIVSLGSRNFNLLSNSISEVDSATKNKDFFEEVNNELLLAENEYRIYLFNHDTASGRAFQANIKNVKESIDRVKTISDTLLAKQAVEYLNRKMAMEESLYKLRSLSDSLLENTSQVIVVPPPPQTLKIERMQNDLLKRFYLSSIDTLRMKQSVKRKTFFQKVQSLFSSKSDKDSFNVEYAKGNQNLTSHADSANTYSDSLIDNLSEQIKNYYQHSVNRQLNYRNDIAEKEKQLALLNISLLDKIKEIFNGVQTQSTQQLSDLIESDRAKIARSQRNLVFISLFTLIFLLVVVCFLVVHLRRAVKYENDIISAKKKAEHLSLMKGRYLSNMSHEIRSPLTSIIGFTEQLEKQKLDVSSKEYLSAIEFASDHLLKLVNDILDFSKLEAGKLTIHQEVFNPREAIEEVVYGMKILASKKNLQILLFAKFDESIMVTGDKLRLNQILYNLISNAIKFTNKGRITINATLRELANDEMNLSIVVEDTGIGIPQNQLETIFEEFSQLNVQNSAQETPINRGTGLGLSISKMLIEVQGGTITADSTQSVGSTFYVSLPYKKAAKISSPKTIISVQTAVPKTRINSGKILLAEDNDLNIMLLSNIFHNNKINFDLVTDGEDGLKAFEEKDYDLVITDIFLPGLSGIDLTKQIRKNLNTTKSGKPVLAFTSNVLKEDIDLYQKAGITDYISKPTTEKALLDKIKKYL